MNQIKIERIPKSNNRSLKAWSSADEYLLAKAEELKSQNDSVIVLNDRFGFLANHLSLLFKEVYVINDSYCSNKACQENLKNNKIDVNVHFLNPLSEIPKNVKFAFLKIPKSNDLFELYINQLVKSNKNIEVYAGFMTRNFNASIIDIAEKYFENISQSLALKKSRILICLKPYADVESELINNISSAHGSDYKQYFGVFSSKKIDVATEFLISEYENLKFEFTKALDLASGNGVIARNLQEVNQNAEIHLIDDSYLAVESSKFNIEGEKIHFHNTCDLDELNEKFDLIITNPPFHIEFENNIEVSLELFKQAKSHLTDNGKFIVVANKHLNYLTHLERMFDFAEEFSSNERFVIYRCGLVGVQAC